MAYDLSAGIELIVAEVAELKALYLFGSEARGDSSGHSDIDLAILADKKLTPLGRWELQERVAAKLGRDVDLVDLRSASAVMRVEVLRDGNLLVDRDPSARQSFEAFALSDYARLQEERSHILADIERRGRVYG